MSRQTSDSGYPNPPALKGLDIPVRIRLIITVLGILGVGLVIMESLVGGGWGTIETDKIIHFSGYGILAAIFVLALRPKYFIPVLLLLVAVGWVVELIQPQTGRTLDVRDGQANTLGVAIGAMVGLIIRNVYSFLHRDLALKKASQRLFRVEAGTIVARQGDPVHELLIIKSGKLKLWREVDGEPKELATLGGGQLVGAIGAIRGEPYYTTVEAETPVLLYRMSLDELTELAGGPDQPLSMVILGLAKTLRTAGELLAEHQQEKSEG